jgi:hypothetical protein
MTPKDGGVHRRFLIARIGKVYASKAEREKDAVERNAMLLTLLEHTGNICIILS